MKATRFPLAVLVSLALSTAAAAASIDMDDPRRLLGRDGDVRVDAQLLKDTVTPGAPVAITYQIQNLSSLPVAVADKLSDATYDEDERTITLAVGSEVPPDGNMPHMVVVAPGEKKLFTTAATPAFNAATMRSSFPLTPRFVQVKVAILRDLSPYMALIEKQSARGGQRLSDALFEQWFESNDTIYLNAVPVRYTPPVSSGIERRQGGW